MKWCINNCDFLYAAPQDHLLLSNRSHVMHTMGRAEEALKDAEAAIRCRPEWAKGYFRKAMALTSLGRFEDSIVSLLQCAILEESISLHNIKDEISKVYLLDGTVYNKVLIYQFMVA